MAVDARGLQRLAVQHDRFLAGRQAPLIDPHLVPVVVDRRDQAIGQVRVDLVFGDAIDQCAVPPPLSARFGINVPLQVVAAIAVQQRSPPLRRDHDRRGAAQHLDRLPCSAGDPDKEAFALLADREVQRRDVRRQDDFCIVRAGPRWPRNLLCLVVGWLPGSGRPPQPARTGGKSDNNDHGKPEARLFLHHVTFPTRRWQDRRSTNCPDPRP